LPGHWKCWSNWADGRKCTSFITQWLAYSSPSATADRPKYSVPPADAQSLSCIPSAIGFTFGACPPYTSRLRLSRSPD
jgi:hypothetical protein